MKVFLGLTAMLTMGYLVVAADAPSKVTYVGHDKVTTALAKGGPLVNGPDLLVSGSHRDKAGQVEVHDKETDVIYVIDGVLTGQDDPHDRGGRDFFSSLAANPFAASFQ